MTDVFDLANGGSPYFGAWVLPEAALGFDPYLSHAHVPGRHLNGLLAAEAAGIAIDEEAVARHRAVLLRSFSGPVKLPLNGRSPMGPPEVFLAHNIREGLHGLHTLVRYRESEEAADLARDAVAAIFSRWDPATGWDLEEPPIASKLLITGLGRAVGPLVKLAAATGEQRALDLASVVVAKLTASCFPTDGAFRAETMGNHVHSITSSLSSLAQFAEFTGDRSLLDRVWAFYGNGLWRMRDELGWAIEGFDPTQEWSPDKGEGNSTGDILETALILGRNGHWEAFDDAELILRAHLLPSQLRDISFVPESPEPATEDRFRDVGRRLRGAFGFPAPYGHVPLGLAPIKFNLDIVGGVTGSLCAAHGAMVRHLEGETRVDLLFDHADDRIEVQSTYARIEDALRIRTRHPGRLAVRIPGWSDPREWSVATAARSARGPAEVVPSRVDRGYLVLDAPPVGQWVELRFHLTERELTLHHGTRDIGVRLRGDSVVGMDSFGADLTFFPDLDA